MFGFYFFISGIVKRGNRLGKKMGFLIINIKFDKEKIVLKKGVYVINIIIDDKRYFFIINVGINLIVLVLENIKIEIYVLGVDKDLYGK